MQARIIHGNFDKSISVKRASITPSPSIKNHGTKIKVTEPLKPITTKSCNRPLITNVMMSAITGGKIIFNGINTYLPRAYPQTGFQ